MFAVRTRSGMRDGSGGVCGANLDPGNNPAGAQSIEFLTGNDTAVSGSRFQLC